MTDIVTVEGATVYHIVQMWDRVQDRGTAYCGEEGPAQKVDPEDADLCGRCLNQIPDHHPYAQFADDE